MPRGPAWGPRLALTAGSWVPCKPSPPLPRLFFGGMKIKAESLGSTDVTSLTARGFIVQSLFYLACHGDISHVWGSSLLLPPFHRLQNPSASLELLLLCKKVGEVPRKPAAVPTARHAVAARYGSSRQREVISRERCLLRGLQTPKSGASS